MRLLRPFLCAALACVATLPAQQAAPLDAKTQQQYERLLRHRYSRDLSEVFAAMEKSARPDARAGADARFLSAFRLGDWAQVRAELAAPWGRLDGFLHAIAFAPQDALGGNFLHTP